MQQAKGKKHAEFSYYTEVQDEVTQLQSHVKEFDPLRSVETEEKINDISWMRPQGKNLYVLTTNNKTIKLWKLSNRMMKKVVKSAGKELAMPKLQVVEDGLVPTLM
jgi:serine/threonine-protein phosphatase 2A regulatory subunit B